MLDIPVEKLTIAQAIKELEDLASVIRQHDELYYNKAAPIVSDAEYDQLRRRYTEIERRFPNLRQPDSPSWKVGAKPEKDCVKVRHTVPMLSLSNAFAQKDVQEFLSRLRRLLRFSPQTPLELIAEPKIDGVSLSLSYTNAKLTVAATRGDGLYGEDITKNAVIIQGIPQSLPDIIPYHLEIRGEVYMTRSTFQELNVHRKQQGLSAFSNPRNATAGILRQLKTSPAVLSCLYFVAHSLGHFSHVLEQTYTQTYTQVRMLLHTMGFTLTEAVLCKDYQALLTYYHDVERRRYSFPFDIDGVVYKVDRLDLREHLGSLSRAPRWALAHKFTPNEAQTVLRKISIQVGRTGVLTPVAHFDPVVIHGVVVMRATLHNEEEIQRKDLRIGSSITVQRSGDVIPKIKEVHLSEGSEDSQVYCFPELCPECGSQTFREENKVIRYCSGQSICPAQIKQSFYHFVSRSAFDITGLGPKTIDFLYELGLLRCLSDIFHLRQRDHNRTPQLKEHHGWGEKSVSKLFQVIDSRRTITFDRFLFALGIRHIGEETSRVLAKAYGSMVHLQNMIKKAEDCDNLMYQELIAHIGQCAANSLRAFLSEERNLEVIEDLLGSVSIIESNTKSQSDQEQSLGAPSLLSLQGKRIVFTGKLSNMTRKEAHQQATRLGAQIVKTISKHTDILVVGNNAGSKITKARALRIQVLEEKAWQEFLKHNIFS